MSGGSAPSRPAPRASTSIACAATTASIDISPCARCPFDDGGAIKWAGIHTDIDERKRTEDQLRSSAARLRQSNRELEDFAMVAPHDLQSRCEWCGSEAAIDRLHGDRCVDRGTDRHPGCALVGCSRRPATTFPPRVGRQEGRRQRKNDVRVVQTYDQIGYSLTDQGPADAVPIANQRRRDIEPDRPASADLRP